MNNAIYFRLESLMKKLGFSVSDGSFTKAEMKAYAAAISLAETKMAETLKNVFIDTADNFGLSMFLSMIGEKNASTDSESRKNIISAVSDKRGFYTKSYFESIIKTLGTTTKYIVGGNVMDFSYEGNLYRPRFDDYSKLLTDYNPCTAVLNNKKGREWSSWDDASFRWYEINKFNIPFLTLDNMK